MTCERCGQETSGGGKEHVNVYQCVTNLQTTCGRLRADLEAERARARRLSNALHGFVGFVEGGYGVSWIHEATLRLLARAANRALR